VSLDRRPTPAGSAGRQAEPEQGADHPSKTKSLAVSRRLSCRELRGLG
jgi:hypothetical protein